MPRMPDTPPGAAMRPEELARHDGMGLAELVRRKEVSAAEVLDATIAAVEALNPEINAVVTRLYDQARAAIAAGLPAGPFTGVPYLLKDLGGDYAGAAVRVSGEGGGRPPRRRGDELREPPLQGLRGGPRQRDHRAAQARRPRH